MTSVEFFDILADLRVSQTAFSRLVDITPRAMQKWRTGESRIPGAAIAFLKLFAKLPRERRISMMYPSGRKSDKVKTAPMAASVG
jgi:DNA-binding transcriptional regulator YiaG